MEDRFGKYLRLFGTIFFSVIGFILVIALLLLGIRFVFGLLTYMPWLTYVFMSFIVLVPSALFITCYIIYFKRTKNHRSAVVRWISYILFSLMLISWGIVLVSDIITFFKHAYAEIGMYDSYNMGWLIANVACFFIVGIIQALTTEKEKDWMERRKSL